MRCMQLEQQAARREARGYQDKVDEVTNEVTLKPIVKKTKDRHESLLEQWDVFCQDYQGNVDMTNIKTMKTFFLWLSHSMAGRLDPNGFPTRDTLYSTWRNFKSAVERRDQVVFSRQLNQTIFNHIYHELSLPNMHRPGLNFTDDDFLVCVTQLWQNDWHEYYHERSRVDLHHLILAHCNSSARAGEFETKWKYGDFDISMVWIDERKQSQVIINYKRTNAKGLQNYPREQPEHMIYELVGLPFYCNQVLFFMAAAIADGVFLDYSTWEEIIALEKPQRSNRIPLRIDAEKADWYVCVKCSRNGIISHTQSSTSLANHALPELGIRAGFTERIGFHAARREVLLAVDNYGYSCNERMRFAGHVKESTYKRSYQTPVSSVDGAAAFFGFEPQINALYKERRSFSWNRNPDYHPKLEEKLRVVLLERHDSKDVATIDTDEKERQRKYDKKRQDLKKKLLEQNLILNSKAPTYESQFAQTRKLMPERDRLAHNILKEGSLRDPIGLIVMRDLVALCKENNTPSYCPGLNPSPTHCTYCSSSAVNDLQWQHLYRCGKRNLRNNTHNFVEFCFHCLEWVNGKDDWRSHVQEHLKSPPTKCCMVEFRHFPIQPAMCPDCLGNESCAPERRFFQYLNQTQWKNHLLRCGFRDNLQLMCMHPACTELKFPNMTTKLDHAADCHEIRFSAKDRRRILETTPLTVQESRFTDLKFVLEMPNVPESGLEAREEVPTGYSSDQSSPTAEASHDNVTEPREPSEMNVPNELDTSGTGTNEQIPSLSDEDALVMLPKPKKIKLSQHRLQEPPASTKRGRRLQRSTANRNLQPVCVWQADTTATPKLSDESVRRTRSGRASIKPLAYWSGEKFVFGSDQVAEETQSRFPVNKITEIYRVR